MLPWKTIIDIKKDCDTPVYLQIANSLIQEIRKGRVGPSVKLPGTRQMSELLDVHRKTLVNAYEELNAQGWIEMIASKGTFTSKEIPEVNPRLLATKDKRPGLFPATTGYQVKVNDKVRDVVPTLRSIMGFHDGPDVRLTPVEELAKTYKSVLTRPITQKFLSYVDNYGVQKFRTVLSDYLNESRGLQTTYENIMITRGSQMALYLLARVLFEKGDNVIVGDTNYYYADHAFTTAHANLVRVKVDDFGLDVDAIEKICKRKKIKAVYLTSHHHYPTTVTLIASRRVKLLCLANQYGFTIIEDDYDYDFHYCSSPILPLISADDCGMVVYVGTLSKTISPAIRTGYIIAPKNLLNEVARLRQLVDGQGDPIMELALAEMFDEGEIRRHMKKALKTYHERRDFFCDLLRNKLSDVIDFRRPDGGLAIWAKFDKSVPLPQLNVKMKAKGIIISNGLINNTGKTLMNANRMGFAWMNEKEAEKAILILNDTIRQGF